MVATFLGKLGNAALKGAELALKAVGIILGVGFLIAAGIISPWTQITRGNYQIAAAYVAILLTLFIGGPVLVRALPKRVLMSAYLPFLYAIVGESMVVVLALSRGPGDIFSGETISEILVPLSVFVVIGTQSLVQTRNTARDYGRFIPTSATLSGHTSKVRTASFSPDGERVVTACWDLPDIARSEGVITAAGDHTARIWDANTGAALATLSGHTDWVNSASFSPDGSRVVTASEDQTARVWDANTGELLATLAGHTGWAASASFSPDGSRIATRSGDYTARLFDANTGEALATLSGHTAFVSSVSFSPDGFRVITGSYDHTARMFDAKTGTLAATLSGHTDYVNSASFSPDGSRIVTASGDKTARVWDANTGELLTTLSGHTDSVNSASFSPDGTRVVTGGAYSSDTIRVWDARTGAMLSILSGHVGMSRPAFSPDGARIVVTDGFSARLFEADTGELIATLTGHTNWVNSAAFSPDGTRIVTASDDHTTRLWIVLKRRRWLKAPEGKRNWLKTTAGDTMLDQQPLSVPAAFFATLWGKILAVLAAITMVVGIYVEIIAAWRGTNEAIISSTNIEIARAQATKAKAEAAVAEDVAAGERAKAQAASMPIDVDAFSKVYKEMERRQDVPASIQTKKECATVGGKEICLEPGN